MRRYVILCCMLLLSLPIMAQEMNTGLDESLEAFAFMIGDWQVESRRDVNAFDEQTASEWEETTGVATIKPLLGGVGLLQEYTGIYDGDLYESTVFRGAPVSVDGEWHMAWTDTLPKDRVWHFRGRLNQDAGQLELESRPRRGESWYTVLKPVNDDSFVWEVLLVMGPPDREAATVIWTMTFNRMAANESYAEQAERLRADYDTPAPPERINDFRFWEGTWTVDYDFGNGQVTGLDRIDYVSGGHAFVEEWQALDGESVLFFTMTVWNTERDYFFNWFWSGRTRSPDAFTGGRCTGDGMEKVCRLAGRFFNITDDTIDWELGSTTMAFTRTEPDME